MSHVSSWLTFCMTVLNVCLTEHERRRDQGLWEATDEETHECEVPSGARRLDEGVEGSEEGRHEEVSGDRIHWACPCMFLSII